MSITPSLKHLVFALNMILSSMTLFQLLLLGATVALFQLCAAAPVTSLQAGSIVWGPCSSEFNSHSHSAAPISCASLPVPLDYTDETSNKTLDLQLLRWPAKDGPSNQSVIFNFGGPGGDAKGTPCVTFSLERSAAQVSSFNVDNSVFWRGG